MLKVVLGYSSTLERPEEIPGQKIYDHSASIVPQSKAIEPEFTSNLSKL